MLRVLVLVSFALIAACSKLKDQADWVHGWDREIYDSSIADCNTDMSEKLPASALEPTCKCYIDELARTYSPSELERDGIEDQIQYWLKTCAEKNGANLDFDIARFLRELKREPQADKKTPSGILRSFKKARPHDPSGAAKKAESVPPADAPAPRPEAPAKFQGKGEFSILEWIVPDNESKFRFVGTDSKRTFEEVTCKLSRNEFTGLTELSLNFGQSSSGDDLEVTIKNFYEYGNTRISDYYDRDIRAVYTRATKDHKIVYSYGPAIGGSVAIKFDKMVRTGNRLAGNLSMVNLPGLKLHGQAPNDKWFDLTLMGKFECELPEEKINVAPIVPKIDPQLRKDAERQLEKFKQDFGTPVAPSGKSPEEQLKDFEKQFGLPKTPNFKSAEEMQKDFQKQFGAPLNTQKTPEELLKDLEKLGR